MKVIIHGRDVQLAEDFSEIAIERLERLARFNIVIDRIDVEVVHEQNPKRGKNSHRVVLTSHGSGPLLRAEGEGFNDLSAFDTAAEIVEFQLRKLHERSKEIDRTTLRKRRAV